MYLNKNQLKRKVDGLINRQAELIILKRRNKDFKTLVQISEELNDIDIQLEELEAEYNL